MGSEYWQVYLWSASNVIGSCFHDLQQWLFFGYQADILFRCFRQQKHGNNVILFPISFFFLLSFLICYGNNAGNTGQWFCIESSTTATTKAHDTKTTTGRYIDSIIVALLCSRWAFIVNCNVENSSSAITLTTTIVSIQQTRSFRENGQPNEFYFD